MNFWNFSNYFFGYILLINITLLLFFEINFNKYFNIKNMEPIKMNINLLTS